MQGPTDPTVEAELSPLAEAMATLEREEIEAVTTPEQVTPAETPGDPATTRPLPTAPAARHGSAFRTAAQPGVPSWTTITPASADDLERIIGITAAIADTLQKSGVTNYTQLAAVRDEELTQMLTEAGIQLPPALPTWSVQAALLLQGDPESAATLAGGLMIGREKS